MTFVKNALAAGAVVTLLSSSIGPALAADNLLNNGDFGIYTNSTTRFSDWTESDSVTRNNISGNNWAGLGFGSTAANPLSGIISQSFTASFAGTYSVSFDWLLRAVNSTVGSASLSAILTSGSGPAVTLLSLSKSSGGATSNTSVTSVQLAALTEYTIEFTGSRARIDNVNVAAVPGPIAGAGLPLLLGLAGYGAFRRRKAVAA